MLIAGQPPVYKTEIAAVYIFDGATSDTAGAAAVASRCSLISFAVLFGSGRIRRLDGTKHDVR